VLILYAWLIYPFILAVLARGRPASRSGLSPAVAVDVNVCFSAYNEEKVIRQRLENLIQLRITNYELRIQESEARGQRADDRRQTTDHSLQSTAYSSQSTGIQVFVGVDGSTDRTAEIAREFAGKHDNVHVLEFKERRGKVAVLKDLVRASKTVGHAKRVAGCGLWTVDCKEGKQVAVGGEKECLTTDEHRLTHLKERDSDQSTVNSLQSTSSVLVFTDANTMFRPDALEKLLVHFSDPKVGGVCGRLDFKENDELRIKNDECKNQEPDNRPQTTDYRPQTTDYRPQTTDYSPQTAAEQTPSEGFYWRWETQLKVMESRLDSCLGANGAIYALRSGLFWKEVPDNTIVDDFVIGMKVRERGLRFIYDPQAVAEEEFPVEKSEWQRRVRIGAGDYQALALCGKCLLPQYGEFAWMFWSHKVLRWFTPHMLLLLALCSLFAVGRGTPVAEFMLAGISVFLLCALAGTRVKALAVFRHFVVMLAALFAGFLRFLSGNLKGFWERTPRR